VVVGTHAARKKANVKLQDSKDPMAQDPENDAVAMGIWYPQIDSTHTEVSLQAWSLCSQMTAAGFSVQPLMSSSDKDRLHIKIGLPYQLLVEEAEEMSISMRLRQTKGTCEFHQELMPRFPQFEYRGRRQDTSKGRTIESDTMDGPGLTTCFTSAHAQQLTMHRMKRVTRIYPQMLVKTRKKGDLLKKLKDKVDRQSKEQHVAHNVPHDSRGAIRAHDLFLMLQAFGAYRPQALSLFGHAVAAVAKEVRDNPWLVIRKNEARAPPQPLTTTPTTPSQSWHPPTGAIIDWLTTPSAGGRECKIFSEGVRDHQVA
jgi:hypothetical protein